MLKLPKKCRNDIIVLVIGTLIAYVITSFCTNFFSKIESSIVSGDFFIENNNIIYYLIFVVLIIIAVLFVFFNKKKCILINNIKQKKSKTIEENEFFRYSDTPSFFDERLCLAFPRIHDLHWIEDSKKATYRLSIFFNTQLKFIGRNNGSIVPICWTRDHSYSPITDFKILKSYFFGKTKILINYDEMIIDKIAVYKSSRRYYNFIYIELKPDKQSGVFPIKEKYINEKIKMFGYADENFALIKNKIPILLEEYSDGAALIGKKIVDVKNAIRRRRYLSKYNFIICPQDSVFNLRRYTDKYDNICNKLLNKEITIEELIDIIQTYEKHEILKY